MGQKKLRLVGLAQLELHSWFLGSGDPASGGDVARLALSTRQPWLSQGTAMGREFAGSLQATRKPQERFSYGLIRDLKHRLLGQEPESHSPTHCKFRNVGRGPRTGPSGAPLPTMGSRWRCGPGLARAAGRWKGGGGGDPERKTSGKQGFKRRTICSKTFAL